jgi:hypothetical protein
MNSEPGTGTRETSIPGQRREAAGKQVFGTMFPIVRKTYLNRGAKNELMNGRSVLGDGRADVRLAVDQAGDACLQQARRDDPPYRCRNANEIAVRNS